MSIMPCPGCGVPAEITERFILASTDGPITHVAVCCVDGHHYRMEADRLPADRSQPPAPRPPAPRPPAPRPPQDGPRPESVMSGTPAGTSAAPGGARPRPAPRRLRSRLGPGRLRAMLGPGHLPHTFPLCIHCLANPAGFWVSGTGSNVVRRPWCLSCCQDLDRERCDMTPFGG